MKLEGNMTYVYIIRSNINCCCIKLDLDNAPLIFALSMFSFINLVYRKVGIVATMLSSKPFQKIKQK